MARLFALVTLFVTLGVSMSAGSATRTEAAQDDVASAVVVPPGATATLVKPRMVEEGSVTLTNRSMIAVSATLTDTLRLAAPPDSTIAITESDGVQRIRCPDDPGSRDGCFSVTGEARLVFTVVPQTRPAPASPPPPSVPEGAVATIPPGATVLFAGPSLLSPDRMRSIAVTNQSDEPATAVRNGYGVTLVLPEQTAINGEVVYEGLDRRIEPCAVHPRMPNVARCRWAESRATNASVLFTTATDSAPPALEEVALRGGCTNVILTWPAHMPLEWIAETVEPAAALEAIWRVRPLSEGFIGFAPGAPADANDYHETVESLEPVFLCLGVPATLARPA